ncbi:MAG: hypothetical protein GY851_11505 [bacterium]|nr:hypothetical protein [bacterium]
MTDNTSERLKQFRAENDPPKPAPVRWLVGFLVVFLMGAVAGFAGLGLLHGGAAPGSGGGPSEDQLRRLAMRLEEKALPSAAIDAYATYLAAARLDDAARAKVCYSVGKLAVDAGDYERALTFLYESELLDPESDLARDIDKKVVFCLEKLGRTVDLRRELTHRTSVTRTPDASGAGEVVLAEFGDERVTERDLELELEKLPASARDSFRTPDQRLELLRNMVAERLLLDKAHRLELDKDPEIQELLAAQRDALVVRKLIADEVDRNVKVSADDVERFYKAEKSLFSRPAQADVLVAREGEEFGDKPVTVHAGRSIPGIPESAEAVEAILAAEPNTTVGPLAVGDAPHLFKVISKQAERVLPFDEVREQAQRMLHARKEQEQVRAIIEETLKAQDVRIHADRLQQTEEGK